MVFLRKIIPGATDKSYGIHVARIAGVPRKVIDRANTIMNDVEDRDTNPGGKVRRYTQMLLVDTPVAPRDPVLLEIEGLSVDTMTPVEALTWLNELQKRVKSGNSGGPEKFRNMENPSMPRHSVGISKDDKRDGDMDRTRAGERVNGGEAESPDQAP